MIATVEEIVTYKRYKATRTATAATNAQSAVETVQVIWKSFRSRLAELEAEFRALPRAQQLILLEQKPEMEEILAECKPAALETVGKTVRAETGILCGDSCTEGLQETGRRFYFFGHLRNSGDHWINDR